MTTAATWTVTGPDFIRALSNAAVFAGKDDNLPALNAVRLEVSEPDQNGEATLTAVATDRYMIGMDTCPVIGATAPGELLLRLDDVTRLVRAIKAERHLLYVVVWLDANGKVSVDVADTRYTLTQQDGAFPKYRSLIPDENAASDGITGIAFNPSYLARFDKVKGGSRTEPMKLRFTTPTKPAVVTIGETFTGLIMPVRIPA